MEKPRVKSKDQILDKDWLIEQCEIYLEDTKSGSGLQEEHIFEYLLERFCGKEIFDYINEMI